ncbi:DUF4209 domain-containing protein [Desulfolutivibrio sulfoxidireducens]|uniref:DUF4209 domain-containing protein n=1 Tax=Desulfolutivibrio sulfoxidireducens TaxID=2773299 RepID=UPI00159E0A08|nr:DUF4209 domain-containing protein [Desulfolutivibrio sulfoxidireducens]QLA15402.1 DUF4209 domain-containing protein [Desulfolutivibrio sulfoxidireducens]
MNTTHENPDSSITVDDFLSCDLGNVVPKKSLNSYISLRKFLDDLAEKFKNDGFLKRHHVISLLSKACSMQLNPKSMREPFKPFIIAHGQRSWLAEDFLDKEIELFYTIFGEININILQARIADIIWYRNKAYGISVIKTAILAYKEVPINPDTWHSIGRECLERAICLAKIINNNKYIADIEHSVVSVYISEKNSNTKLSFWLAEFLLENKLGTSEQRTIAADIENKALAYKIKNNYLLAIDNFNAAIKWYKLLGDQGKITNLKVFLAECHVEEATAKASTESSGNIIASSIYESALQILRSIPKSNRKQYNIDARITEITNLLHKSGKNALEEMMCIRTSEIDITDTVEASRESIRNKNPLEALLAFANVCGLIDSSKTKANANKQALDFPLLSLFPTKVMNQEGRVVAKSTGIDLGADDSSIGDDELSCIIMRNIDIDINLHVSGCIIPALETLHTEHQFNEKHFVDIATHSQIIPPGRGMLFGKAVFSGYDFDFMTSLHILIPQIEHMIRYHFNLHNIITTNIDSNGVETEKGLGPLVNMPEFSEIFGDNISFTLRAVLCDPFGPNLRNELAHGLLDDDAFNSIYSVYIWWFCFKIVFAFYWNRVRPTDQNSCYPASTF